MNNWEDFNINYSLQLKEAIAEYTSNEAAQAAQSIDCKD